MSAGPFRVVPAGEEHVPSVVAYVAAAQTRPERHVTYVGLDADTIHEEFAEAEAWTDRLLVRLEGDRLSGVLLADIDRDMRRVWWLGPWADGEDAALALLSEGRERFGGMDSI